MEIKAADVMKLRHATNAGMMDCKKALQEAEGDFDKAVDIIRKKGLLVASKRADREAKEGCVLARAEGKKGVLVSLNCETDFVAKNENFINFTRMILDCAFDNMPADKEALLALQVDGRSIADQIAEQTGVIGEKLELAYYGKLEAEATIAYIHPGNKLATVVGFNKEADNQIKKDVAMQAAAMAPIAVDRHDVPQHVIEHELEIGRDKAREEGKSGSNFVEPSIHQRCQRNCKSLSGSQRQGIDRNRLPAFYIERLIQRINHIKKPGFRAFFIAHQND